MKFGKKMRTIMICLLCVLSVCALSVFFVACDKGSTGGASDCEFSEVDNFNVKINSTVDWTEGVTATTKSGKSLKVTADASDVDLTKVGTYTVIIKAEQFSIRRTVRVYDMPVLTYKGEVVENGDVVTMTYGESTGVRGYTTGMECVDSFNTLIEITATETGTADGGKAVTWSATDAAGNTLSIAGVLKIDTTNAPTAQNAAYDLVNSSVTIVADVKGASQVTLWENNQKINLKYYDITADGIVISGEYFTKTALGERNIRLLTEFGYKDFVVTVTDNQPLSFDGLYRMDGYVFMEGENVIIPRAPIGAGYQQIKNLSYAVTGGTAVAVEESALEFGALPVGDYTVTITAQREGETAEEKTIGFKVKNRIEYYAELLPGTANQFVDRVLAGGKDPVATSISYEYLDKETYGVTGAYRFVVDNSKASDAWNHRFALTAETASEFELTSYSYISFDLWINSKDGANFPFAIYSKSEGATPYIPYVVKDKATGVYETGALTDLSTGKWYNFTASIPGNCTGGTFYLIFANNDQSIDVYMRDLKLVQESSTEMRYWFAKMMNQASDMYAGVSVGGRTDVTKVVQKESGWYARLSFTNKALSNWNAAVTATGNSYFYMDIYFETEKVNPVFWTIQSSMGTVFGSTCVWTTTGDNPQVVSWDNVQPNTWYTLRLDVKAIGEVIRKTGGDTGIQLALNGGSATSPLTYYMDNFRLVTGA